MRFLKYPSSEALGQVPGGSGLGVNAEDHGVLANGMADGGSCRRPTLTIRPTRSLSIPRAHRRPYVPRLCFFLPASRTASVAVTVDAGLWDTASASVSVVVGGVVVAPSL